MTDLEMLNLMEQARQHLYKAGESLMDTSEYLSVELDDATSAIEHAISQIRVAMEDFKGLN
jgi:hypothetical protein